MLAVNEERLLDNMFHSSTWNISKVSNLKQYKNIIEWITKGLHLTSIYDHTRQYEVLRDFFQLLCPICAEDMDYDCWGKTPEQLMDQILLQLDWDKEIFICPVCNYSLNRLTYENLIVCVGMRAGKTVLGALISTYILMMYFALGEDIDNRFNLIPGQRLRISMVSTAASQTEKTVWAAFCSLMVDMEIFKKGVLNAKEWKYGNLEVLSLHSNSSSLAGGTGLLTILEEFSRFDLGESKRSANEVHAVLDRSLKTVKSVKKTAIDDLFGRKLILSSPIYIEDIDPTLLEIKKADDLTKIIHLPTWKFNPFMPRETFDEDYRRDFWRAERDYGANPKGGQELFFEDEQLIVNCIKNEDRKIKFQQIIEYKGRLKFITSTVDNFVDTESNYSVHVDLSEKKDIMSMAFAKRQDDMIIVAGVMVLIPDGVLNLWLDTPFDIILQLSKQIKIQLVTYDNWQSVSAIQRLNTKGILTKRRSVGEAELIEFKKLAYLEKVKILGPVPKLLEEIKTIRRINGKLIHVDVLMSVAGAVTNWMFGETEKVKKLIVPTTKMFRVKRW